MSPRTYSWLLVLGGCGAIAIGVWQLIDKRGWVAPMVYMVAMLGVVVLGIIALSAGLEWRRELHNQMKR